MKKIIIIVSLLIFLVVDATIAYLKVEKEEDIRAIYISYIEYMDNFLGNTNTINKVRIDKMLDNIKINKFNTVILHTSPFSDAIYSSKIFPYSYTLTGVEGKNPGFDYLEYFIKKAHQKKIKIYAWINPYRIRMDKNTSKISLNNPAYQLLNTKHVMVDDNGIYYNPTSEIVKNLIVSQIKEIISNYEVDGIHFDDYFYMQKDIDKIEYSNYLLNGGQNTLQEFRLENTNDLVERVYSLIKKTDSNIVFSISPDGNINNNYKYHYADVKTWLSSNKYIDMIMPQIYYGFENEYSPFTKVINDWQKLITNDKIDVVPILGFYKVGNIDNDSGIGKNEWLNNDDIIKRQVEVIKDNNLKGFGLFRYDYLFNKNYHNNITQKELNNLQKAY